MHIIGDPAGAGGPRREAGAMTPHPGLHRRPPRHAVIAGRLLACAGDGDAGALADEAWRLTGADEPDADGLYGRVAGWMAARIADIARARLGPEEDGELLVLGVLGPEGEPVDTAALPRGWAVAAEITGLALAGDDAEASAFAGGHGRAADGADRVGTVVALAQWLDAVLEIPGGGLPGDPGGGAGGDGEDGRGGGPVRGGA